MRFVRTTLLTAVIVAVGCTDGEYFGTTAPKHPPSELWINNATEPEWVDPGKCADAIGGEIIFNIFAGLTQPHPQTLKPMPDIAKRWERSADGKTFTFYLRKTEWSDGTPLTARDFEWSWRRVLDPKTASKYSSFLYVLEHGDAFNQGALLVTGLAATTTVDAVKAAFEKVVAVEKVEASTRPLGMFVYLGGDDKSRAALRKKAVADLNGAKLENSTMTVEVAPGSVVGVHAVDDLTLKVDLAQPVPYFLDLASFYTAMPVPRHVIERLEREGKNTDLWTRPENIVSNGAYTISEWQFRRRMVLSKNSHYWDQEHVRTPTIRLLEVEGYNTALNLYRAGEIDWIGTNTNLPAEFIDHLKTFKDYEVSPYLTIYWYWFNTERPPLTDVRVREALSLAIDRESICKYVKRSGEIPTADIVPDGLAGYKAIKTPLFDAERARKLLAEAGFPEGKGFPEISLIYNSGEGHKQLAEAMQEMWKKNLGITIRLENQEWKVFLNNMENGNFDIGRLGWVGDYPDPYTFLEVLSPHSGNNHSKWRDPEYGRLLEVANQTVDPDARLLALRAAESYAMAARPLLPAYVYTRDHTVKPYVRGLWTNYQDRHPFKYLWIDERWYDGVQAQQADNPPPPMIPLE